MSETAKFKHPNYWAVWGLLFALTVVEVGVTFLPWAKELLIILLLGMAIWKAVLVALYFMHLRFEKMRLRIFVLAPLPLTVIIVVAVLTEFVW